ncbi:hypothetical protein [Pelomonas sp. KK5]|uniref:hypothetical protein n=1 Tax=Pelomonas sp. KK5 TaxID=1855730 RepID=UPI001301AEE1|nr:hypothetical protein [Pelomonas sp. KK5]
MKFPRSTTRVAGALLAVALAAAPALSQAQGRGHWHGGGGYHGWHGGGWGWGPVFGLALGVDLALSSPYYYDPYYPRTVVVPPPVVYQQAPAVTTHSSTPEPVIYPRNGQSPAQTESDMRACNSWATGQPNAMADASVFQRATAACMDGRGYSIR